MHAETTKNITVDYNLESYRTFFDHSWARELTARLAGSALEEPVFSLVINWKSAANAHLTPWLMIENLALFATHYSKTHEAPGEAYVNKFAAHVGDAMRGSLSNMKMKQLHAEIKALSDKLRTSRESLAIDVDRQSLFTEYLTRPGSHELTLSVWGTQRIVYSAVYHAYEHFVVRCIGLLRDEPNFRITTASKIAEAAKHELSAAVFESCIDDANINIARLVRNALAHNGGRETGELKGEPHDIVVNDGELQIMPNNNRELFDLLKDRASMLAGETMARLQARTQ